MSLKKIKDKARFVYYTENYNILLKEIEILNA